MTALKWITTEAKKLKKAHPKRFATWREYVAQASAIYASKHKGKSPVGKKHKVSGSMITRRKKTAVKKVVKKAAPKKSAAKSYHKDTASHNVKISVMSGIGKDKSITLKSWLMVYGRLQTQLLTAKTAKEKRLINKEIKIAKSIISKLK